MHNIIAIVTTCTHHLHLDCSLGSNIVTVSNCHILRRYCIGRNVGVELNLAVGKINSISPNIIPLTLIKYWCKKFGSILKVQVPTLMETRF